MKVTVSTKWLSKNLNKENLIIIDFSWYLPSEKRDAYKEFLKNHIPGSIYIDLDNLSEIKSSFPHMLPNKEKFEIFMRNCGVKNNSKIVVYDTSGIWSSPRLWWMLRYFGFNDVFILNGGLKKWKFEKRKMSKKLKKIKYGNFKSKINKNNLSKIESVHNNLFSKKTKIIDARNDKRFNGTEKEPRKNLRTGHVPSSLNLFWKKIINKDGTIKKNKEIEILLNELKISKKNNIICTCGSGVTACIINLSLAKLNYNNVSVYDGSWSEWGSIKKMPIS